MPQAYMQSLDGHIIKTDRPDLWSERKRIPEAEGKRLLKARALKELRRMLKPGSTVLTVLRHASASGMSRRIDLFIVRKNGLVCLTGYAADAMGENVHKNGGIQVGGCGMDMGFHLVYALGHAMWPKGTAKPHGKRNGEPDHDGGYALRHKWI